MQRTKSKILSILLSLVMLLSLLPTTALAADTYPAATAVSVDGNKSFSEPGCYYFKNGASACSKDSSGSNAAYNPTTGTLTLNGYNGGSITAGDTGAKVTVDLVGDNYINNGSLVGSWGSDITVTSSSGGTLTITNTTDTYSDALVGIKAGYGGSFPTGNVTIKGNAEVTVNMTHNGTQTYDKAYGIFAKENITISENASVGITCATPNNTGVDGTLCNGLRAVKDVIIDTTGKVKIDVTGAGGDNTQSYGIFSSGKATLTNVGEMEIEWKKHKTNSNFSGAAILPKGSGFDTSPHAVNVDTENCYASYRKGDPYTVTVQNGTLTGPGVKYANGSGNFLENDTVNITPYERKSNGNEVIPFKEWTAEGVTLTSPSTKDTSFNVPTNDVTVTATYNPFDGTPVFKRTDNSSGTIAFQTKVKPDDGAEYFQYVKVGKETDPYGYNTIAPQPTTASTASPYEYSVSASNYYTGGDITNLEAGDYRMAVTLNSERYLSDSFNVDYTAAVTTYTVSFNANGGTGSMADVTGVSGEYTLPANGFTAPSGKQFKAWSVGGVEKAVGDKITVTANTTVTAIWEPIPATTYTVSFNANGGTGTMADVTGVTGSYTLPTCTFTAPSGKQFKGWATSASGTVITGTSITVSADTTLYAIWTYTGGGGGGGSYTPSYTVSVDKTENGTITVSPKSASKGDTVTITVKPDKGYELDTLKVLDKNGDKVKLTEKNGKYTFTMPTGKVTVKGSFVEEAPVQIFKDVPVDAYYYEAVKWAAEKGITGGVGNDLFAPNAPCTRAQIVTFLWRAAGSPAPKNMSSFADVPADAFYAKAVAWAVENGITGGTGDGKFSPDATCTRAQAVTFLYRASGAPAVSGNAAFSDVATNAYYAAAVKWAEKNGITGGIGGGLFGSDNNCTRAQIVTFLYRAMK